MFCRMSGSNNTAIWLRPILALNQKIYIPFSLVAIILQKLFDILGKERLVLICQTLKCVKLVETFYQEHTLYY
jgi:hypothetical protein